MNKSDKATANEYPESKAHIRWQLGDVQCSIVRHPQFGHLCGYARFPARPVREEGYRGIVTYVPVHGGITYAEAGADGSICYGFDCGHAGDGVEPQYEKEYMRALRDESAHVWTEEEVRAETEKMAMFIAAAAKYEEPYLLAFDNDSKSSILDDYFKEIGGHNASDNFGVMIKLIGGKL